MPICWPCCLGAQSQLFQKISVKVGHFLQKYTCETMERKMYAPFMS